MITMDRFLEIEKDLALNEIRINGCYIWSLLRFSVYIHLTADALMKSKSRKKPIDKFQNRILSLLQLCRLRKAEVCVICDPRRVQENGIYQCMYTGDLVKLFPSCITLERPYPSKHLRPAEEKRLIYLDAWFLPSGAVHKFYQKFNKRKCQEIKAEIYEKLAPAFLQFEAECETPQNWDWCIEKMAEFALSYPFTYKMLRMLLKIISPKVIVEIDHYGGSMMLINEVAKDLQIQTVELQHGIIGAQHVAYNFAAGVHIKHFPDYLLTFSDFWNHSARFPIPPERVIATGFPYLERKMIQYQHKRKIDDSVQTIVFLSSLAGGSEMSSLAVDLIKRFPEKKVRILYKLHPVEYDVWRELYPQLIDSEVEVFDRRDVDVYACFAQADVQVGVSSTALYEGLAFGLDTYILKTAAFERNIGEIKGLCADGYASVFSTAEELAGLIQREKHTEEANSFWKPNALENTHAAIQRIISQRQAFPS